MGSASAVTHKHCGGGGVPRPPARLARSHRGCWEPPGPHTGLAPRSCYPAISSTKNRNENTGSGTCVFQKHLLKTALPKGHGDSSRVSRRHGRGIVSNSSRRQPVSHQHDQRLTQRSLCFQSPDSSRHGKE